MMDGRIGAIRDTLNENQLDEVTIMSYSAKFSSQFTGHSGMPAKAHPATIAVYTTGNLTRLSAFNKNDAILSTLRDIEEGARYCNGKPALPY